MYLIRSDGYDPDGSKMYDKSDRKRRITLLLFKCYLVLEIFKKCATQKEIVVTLRLGIGMPDIHAN